MATFEDLQSFGKGIRNGSVLEIDSTATVAAINKMGSLRSLRLNRGVNRGLNRASGGHGT